MAGYHIGDIYQGGYSSLKPEHSLFTGYRGSIETLGISTDPRTANILKEFSDKLAPGQKIVELSLITPEVIEAIPKQHLQEINRLSKLTGVEATIHGPLLDASGVTQQGTFDEANRQVVERKLLQTLERSHDVNPDGNIPVTFHTANQLPGARYSKVGNEVEIEMMPIVNRDTGQINIVKKDETYYPEKKGEKTRHDAKEKIKIMNETDWNNSLRQIEFHRSNAHRFLQDAHPIFIDRYLGTIAGKINPDDLSMEEINEIKKIHSAEAYMNEAQKSLNSLFDRAYKFGSEEERKRLKQISDQYTKNLQYKDGKPTIHSHDPNIQSNAVFNLATELSQFTPEVYVPAEKYAIEKSVETFGNVAWDIYKKAKKENWKGIPIINIENPPAGFGLSRAEDLKNLVDGSREKFIKNAVENGVSKKEAERQAQQMIGVTWDVGHINQLRQFGFSGKDIIEEAGKVAPLVKHIHLSDNFGYENVELPMGMGNVDFKEVMQKLKEGGTNTDEARKIVEAAHWWIHHQQSPMALSMQALGSPIYSMNMGPSWDQAAGLHQGYFGGYGAFLPQINYETMGAGFSQLPQELGGQRQGGRGSRMGGTPME